MSEKVACIDADCDKEGKHKAEDGFYYCGRCFDSLVNNEPIYNKSEHEWEKWVERGPTSYY